jgi:hypothetical protein
MAQRSLKAHVRMILTTHVLVEPLVPSILSDPGFGGSLMTSSLKRTTHILREMAILRRPKSAKPVRKKGQDKVNASNHEDGDIEKSYGYEDGAGTRIGVEKRDAKPYKGGIAPKKPKTGTAK